MRLDTNAKLIFCKSKFGENVLNVNFKTAKFWRIDESQRAKIDTS